MPSRPPAKPRRASTKKVPPPARGAHAATDTGEQTDPAVDAFLRELEHPHKPELEAVRRLLLAASPDVREGIKWNAPSFRTTEWFATFHLRGKGGVHLILHRGAKARTGAAVVADPAGLVEWLAKDRGRVTLADAHEVREKGAALQALVRAWLREV